MNSTQQRELARRLHTGCEEQGICVEKGTGSGPNIVWHEGSWLEAVAILTRHNFRFTTFEPREAEVVDLGMYLAERAEAGGHP